MQHGFYRPITQCKLTAGLDAQRQRRRRCMRASSGQSILAYLAPQRMENGVDHAAFQGWTPEEFGYMAIPNLLIDHAMRNTHVPVGFWRGVNTNQNAVYMECFIDELAHAAGKDPLEFRRAMMAQEPEAPRRAERRGGKGRVGHAAAARRVPRHLPELRLRQLHRRGCRGVGLRPRAS